MKNKIFALALLILPVLSSPTQAEIAINSNIVYVAPTDYAELSKGVEINRTSLTHPDLIRVLEQKCYTPVLMNHPLAKTAKRMLATVMVYEDTSAFPFGWFENYTVVFAVNFGAGTQKRLLEGVSLKRAQKEFVSFVNSVIPNRCPRP